MSSWELPVMAEFSQQLHSTTNPYMYVQQAFYFWNNISSPACSLLAHYDAFPVLQEDFPQDAIDYHLLPSSQNSKLILSFYVTSCFFLMNV